MDRATRRLETVVDCVEAIRRWTAPYLLPNVDLQRITIKCLELKQLAITHAIERYEKIYEDVKLLPDIEEPARNEAKNQYFTFVNEALELDADLEGLKKKTALVPAAHHPHQQVLLGDQWAKLPKRDLPKFKGNVLDWSEFIDIFTTEVLDCPKFTSCQKLGYLKACLEGTPARLLKNIKQTNDNLQVALGLLRDRYEDADLIREAHFSKVFGLTPMTEQTPAGLRAVATIMVENLQGLKNLNEPVDKWDSWLVYFTKTKMDSTTRKEWETHLVTMATKRPTVQNLMSFLHQTARTLESCAVKSKKDGGHGGHSSGGGSGVGSRRALVGREGTSKFRCYVCDGKHYMSVCPVYLAATPQKRKTKVEELGLCVNCFAVGHKVDDCKWYGCGACGQKHHATLHVEEAGLPATAKKAKLLLAEQGVESESEQEDLQVESDNEPELNSYLSSSSTSKVQEVLLSTMLVKVPTPTGLQICRCLVDSGSQASFITKNCVQRLGIATNATSMKITGIGGKAKAINRIACVPLRSLTEDSSRGEVQMKVDAYVRDKITGGTPRNRAEVKLSLFDSYSLADPKFYLPGAIDLLLGMDIYPALLTEDKPVHLDDLLLQHTVFGWMVSGQAHRTSKNGEERSESSVLNSYHIEATQQLDGMLKRFWELEGVKSGTQSWSMGEKRCEEHFRETFSRDDQGTYTVRLPFKNEKTELGDSKRRASGLFKKTEKRWEKSLESEKGHRESLEEYFHLEHAEPVPIDSIPKKENEVYYLSTSCIEKLSSSTTKYRAVFNGSGPSSTGVSLNDQLLVGPKLQESVFEILARFKTHEVAFTADIEKMYRQIKIHAGDRDFLRFLYRRKDQAQIQEYRMTRVTFGIASSAHQAQRCLLQLSYDEEKRFPLACKVLRRDMYMDDCLSGASTEEEAISLQTQLRDCLKGAGFHLRKWASNSSTLLEQVPSTDQEELKAYDLDLDKSMTKTLGVLWHPATDMMSYSVRALEDLNVEEYTKRYLISDTAKVFDPLGSLAPALMKAKLFFKDLWRLGVDWDDTMPQAIMDEWLKWRKDLEVLKSFYFPRCVIPDGRNVIGYQLHGFSDSSELGYAAVIYLRVMYQSGSVLVRQIAAKTRVAPMKTVTLPRLELCGAYLLSELTVQVQKALAIRDLPCFAWSDSTVTLYWITGDPGRWKTFVARRVSEIQDNIPPANWLYCPTELNPADCASRSLTASQLVSHPLWWSGPDFLTGSEDLWPCWPSKSSESVALSEAKTPKVTTCVAEVVAVAVDILFEMFPYSSLDKIVRITAWCLRWRVNKQDRPKGPLTVKETDIALRLWLSKVQDEAFGEEISVLNESKALPKKSRLLPLAPFVDESGLLRVGGRLKRSELSYNARHQILLPKKHRFTALVIDQIHRCNLHAGPRWMLALLRQKFWIINGLEVLRKHCHKCVFCRRSRAETLQQVMGDLPADRVCPTARAFLKTGVDYAGPFTIRTHLGRNPRKEKVWIAFFVCLSTKASHIEVVTSLETSSFLAALRRFVARRGLVTDLYSDNASTFHGADNELTDFLASLDNNSKIAKALEKDRIQWHFSPHKGSHFGGLWESGIKNMKSLLRSEISSNILTLSELETLCCQVESILNSRPITDLSSDPNDIDSLTPGHFLIGAPLKSVPEPDLEGIKLNRLDRWQLVQSMFQKIWKRYSLEYLHTLQQRRKWLQSGRSVQINDLVIVKDENLASLKWPLARVIEVHPGDDGLVRVVTVRTASGVYKRPIVKLSLLVPAEEL